MGIWGFELYQNDISLDVRDEFEELYNAGKAVEDITDKLMEEYKSIMGDIDEEVYATTVEHIQHRLAEIGIK